MKLSALFTCILLTSTALPPSLAHANPEIELPASVAAHVARLENALSPSAAAKVKAGAQALAAQLPSLAPSAVEGNSHAQATVHFPGIVGPDHEAATFMMAAGSITLGEQDLKTIQVGIKELNNRKAAIRAAVVGFERELKRRGNSTEHRPILAPATTLSKTRTANLRVEFTLPPPIPQVADLKTASSSQLAGWFVDGNHTLDAIDAALAGDNATLDRVRTRYNALVDYVTKHSGTTNDAVVAHLK
jgi:hypothetical protein